MKLVIVPFVSIIVFSCHYLKNTDRKINTPKEYLNSTEVNTARYGVDKKILEHQVRDLMLNHKQSFHSKEYCDSTEIKIDTILYDKNYQKVVVFILTKNPTSRQIMPNKNYSWYYDAYCYLGIKENEGFRLKWMQPFSLINFYSEEDASKYIKEQYFTEFATIKDVNGLYVYKYNLDDSRFWGSPIWNEYFDGAN